MSTKPMTLVDVKERKNEQQFAEMIKQLELMKSSFENAFCFIRMPDGRDSLVIIGCNTATVIANCEILKHLIMHGQFKKLDELNGEK